MLSKMQKNKIKQSFSGKYLLLFFVWVGIFSGINVYINEIYVIGLQVFIYKWTVSVPFILFTTINTFLIALSINLIIMRVKELRRINPGGGVLSIFGVFIALLTGACPGCVAGIFPVFVGLFGSQVTLYSFPLAGVELQILSFAFLTIGIYFLSTSITCTLKYKKPIKHMKKLITILILSAIATFNAGYLTYNAYSIKETAGFFGAGQAANQFACDINSTFSCSSVFSESFAWIFGIPFSLIALIVYPLIIMVALLGIFKKIQNHFKILFFMGIGGLLFNSYIIYNEFLIGAYCLLCLMCTVIIITVMILSYIGNKDGKDDDSTNFTF